QLMSAVLAPFVLTACHNDLIGPISTLVWSSVSSGTTQNLYSVWGTSASDVWAVGSNGTILHYNGTTWSSVASGTTNTLVGIWGSSATDVWAVGGSFTILHYNGISWSGGSSGISSTSLTSVW